MRNLPITLLVLSSAVCLGDEPASYRPVRVAVREFSAERAAVKRGADVDSRRGRSDGRTELRFEPRGTHRGTESQVGPLAVFSSAGESHAVELRETMQEAWQEMTRLFATVAPQTAEPDFAHGSVQVMVTDEVAGDQPFAAVVAKQEHGTMIYLDSSLSKTDEARHASAAAAMAFLQAGGFDRQLPEWVAHGLATYVANTISGETDENSASLRIALAEWDTLRTSRGTPVELTSVEEDAENRVTYLLTGDNAAHAVSFLAALRETLAEPAAASQQEATPVDALFARIENQHAAWRADPKHAASRVHSPRLNEEEEEIRDSLLVVLHLFQRHMEAATARAPTVRSFGAPQPKAAPTTLAVLAAWLQQAEAGEAFLDCKGKLVLPHEHERIEELLGVVEQRYRTAWHQEHLAVTTSLNGHQELRAWLEENPDQSTRKIARFEVINALR